MPSLMRVQERQPHPSRSERELRLLLPPLPLEAAVVEILQRQGHLLPLRSVRLLQAKATAVEMGYSTWVYRLPLLADK